MEENQFDEIEKLRNNQKFLKDLIRDMDRKIHELSDSNENQLMEFNQLNEEYNSIKNKNNSLNEENIKLSNDLNSLLNSRSWRLTSVFRKTKRLLIK